MIVLSRKGLQLCIDRSLEPLSCMEVWLFFLTRQTSAEWQRLYVVQTSYLAPRAAGAPSVPAPLGPGYPKAYPHSNTNSPLALPVPPTLHQPDPSA